MVFTRTPVLRYIGFSFLLLSFGLILSQNSLASTINGFVFDEQRNPIGRVDVELLSENYNTIRRTKTDAIGRYQFSGVNDGRFHVRVLAFRSNFIDQTQEVYVATISLIGPGNGNFEKDFFLKRKKGGLQHTITGVVYVQDVPKPAEELYVAAIEDLQDKRKAEGIDKLRQAIESFPSYYAALDTLGMELLFKKEYSEAFVFFVRAAEVNPKSSRAFYWMGFALNKVDKDGKFNKSALKALEKAVFLAPASWEAALLYGKIHRQEGNFLEAEKYLLKSKKLIDTKNPEIHKELAELYANDLKRYDKAADELELYLKSSKKKDEKTEKLIADLRLKAKKNG